jgi:hypothetical protein
VRGAITCTAFTSHLDPNVNPFSEAQFKTFKYAPGYPDRFGSLADARQWAQAFFT